MLKEFFALERTAEFVAMNCDTQQTFMSRKLTVTARHRLSKGAASHSKLCSKRIWLPDDQELGM
jgi:hypothetical protein